MTPLKVESEVLCLWQTVWLSHSFCQNRWCSESWLSGFFFVSVFLTLGFSLHCITLRAIPLDVALFCDRWCWSFLCQDQHRLRCETCCMRYPEMAHVCTSPTSGNPQKRQQHCTYTHTNLQGNQNMHVFSNLNIVKREIWICYCTLTGSWRSDRQLNLWPEGSIIVHSLFLLYNGVSGTPWCRCCCAALALMWSRLPVKRPAKAATTRLVLTPSCVIHSQSWLNTRHLRFLAELCLEVKAPKDLPADSLFCYEQVH